MRRCWILFPLVLLSPVVLAAQSSPDSTSGTATSQPPRLDGGVLADPAPSDPPPANSLPGAEVVAVGDSLATGDPPVPETLLRLGLKPLDPIFAIRLPRSPGRNDLWLRQPLASWVGEWSSSTRTRLDQRQTVAMRESSVALSGEPPDTVAYLPREIERVAARSQDLLPGVLGEYADIGMMVTGRGELGGSWTRYKPCDAGYFFNCNPSLIPQLRPDIQFGVRVGGTISERVHVNVDYDQRREFDAANNINVFYRGLPDEILQRLEVGDVSIALPQSRYLTQGIPAGNFGFKAEGDVGPVKFQAVWAQQKGDVARREFRFGGSRGPGGLVQDQQLVLDDYDYVKGQFFFLVDPNQITGSPHIDILSLQPTASPATLRPGTTIQVFRFENISAMNPQTMGQLGYFLGRAELQTARHEGLFRRLIQGEDYLVHNSGLWLMLRSPLRQDEALAVSFVTASGEVVGTLDPESATGGSPPLLRLVRAPAAGHQPNQPTWRYEMHQVYRLDSSNGVDLGSVDLEISLGSLSAGRTFKDHFGDQVTYLKLFGLDEESPLDQLDRARIYQPARNAFGDVSQTSRVGGTFIVFPTLQPFADPPPVPSIQLTAEAARQLLGPESNRVIYENANPATREAGGQFKLTARYRVRIEGMVSAFNLGALGVREGSEVITVDGRRLQSGRDYSVDYDIGLVMLNNPDEIFGANPDAEVRAEFEQKPLFQLAPTSVFGANAQYRLGQLGDINVMGLYQAEKSLMTRPQLGLEPASIFMGGINSRMEMGANWLDRALDWIPGLRTTGESGLSLAGELAMSLPNPNTRGDTYLDDFEASDEFTLAMERHLWRPGSRPEHNTGAAEVLPPSLDVASAGSLVWQHDFLADGGRVAGSLLVSSIDRQINMAGAPRYEQVLYMTFGDSLPAAGRKWRSLTSVLSTTGRDMTRSEFLEFYVAADPELNLALVFDVGVVAEDAFVFDSQGSLTGNYPDGRVWGQGVLDEEARLSRGEIWNQMLDTLGLWNQTCRSVPGLQQTYEVGDPRANCTRSNGRVDTEDLNGNGLLDGEGAYYRYVVPLTDLSPYLVRTEEQTGTAFRLYRVPLRGAGAIPVNGASEGTWRYIQHLRMTVTGQPACRAGGPTGFTCSSLLAMTRMRIIGSRWTKRDEHGVLSGPVGSDPGRTLGTRFQVGPVSSLTDGGAYSPPPGIFDQLLDPSSQFGGQGVEFNEKGLKLSYEQLEGDDRVEVYYRYPQQARSLLNYRQLRLWAVARAGNWGAGGDERLMIKLGTDSRNYYLYQAKLNPAATGTFVRQDDWLPELVIDFQKWIDLKAEAMEVFFTTPGQPVAVWSADSTYAVVMDDRFRAPDLAAVREISFAVYNSGLLPATGEVWLNDMRLRGAMTDPGFAGHVSLDMRAGSFATASLAYSNQSELFRQLNQDADYLRTGDVQMSLSTQLGQFAPSGWGLEMPVTVAHSRTVQDPLFLQGSDVQADRLQGLRDTGGESTRLGVSLRKRTPAANPWLGLLVDGSNLRLGYNTRSSRSATSTSESSGIDGTFNYGRRLVARELELVPGFVERALRGLLPQKLEQTEAFDRLVSARLRWSPDNLGFGTTYYNQEQKSWRFEQIVALPSDTAVRANLSPRQGLENTGRIAFRPLESLTADVSVSSSRDLLATDRSNRRLREQQAIEDVRSRLGGVDVGWETSRNMTTTLGYRPPITNWLRPGLSYTARFRLERNPSFLELIPLSEEDTMAVLQRNFQADRQVTRTLELEPRGLARALFGFQPELQSAFGRRMTRVADGIGRIDLNWSNSLGSQFDRELSNPGLLYRFGWGDAMDFRVVDADTAVFVMEGAQFRAATAFRNLPGGIVLELQYSSGETQVFDVRGGSRRQTNRQWPNVRLNSGSITIPQFMQAYVSRLNFSTSYARTRQEASQEGGGAETSGHNNTVPLQVSLGLGRRLNASYSASFAWGSSRDLTGYMDSRNRSHSANLSGSFNAPEHLRETFRNPITMNARVQMQRGLRCRVRSQTGDDTCVPFLDDRSRSVGLSLDTLLEDLIVGFRLDYTSRESFVGMQSGSSQFQVGLYGQFNFSAGNFTGIGR